tara:strand:- start:98 stop:523 length:426 start_codon:yes stop_codon:yes gene_type:complete
MKKLLYIFLAMTLIGCSDSSENEVDNISIVGTWYEIKTEGYENNVLDNVENTKELQVNGCRSYFDFNSDGSLEIVSPFNDCSGFDGQQFGTWELINNSNILSLGYNSGTFEWEIIVLDEDNLTIKYEEGTLKDIMYFEKNY